MSEKAKETFEGYKRRTSGPRWAIRIEYALLHSVAYRSLSYGPALKVLPWCYEKGRDVETNKKKRGEKRYVVTLVDFLFTYEEAAARGLDHKKFARAIRELHARGFVDVVHLGSGLRGNPNKYRLSERWRAFGTDSFQTVTFPENKDWERRFSVVVADGELRRHIPRDEETGKWRRRSEEISQRQISAVVRRTKNAVVNPDRRQISAVQRADFDQNTTAVLPSNLRSTMQCTAPDVDGGPDPRGEEKGLESDRAPSRRNSRTPWRPPKSEIRENVVEVLRRGGYAAERRFVSLLADQLDEAGRNRLDPRRVRRDLQAVHGLDEWTADLLFVIGGLDLDAIEEVLH